MATVEAIESYVNDFFNSMEAKQSLFSNSCF